MKRSKLLVYFIALCCIFFGIGVTAKDSLPPRDSLATLQKGIDTLQQDSITAAAQDTLTTGTASETPIEPSLTEKVLDNPNSLFVFLLLVVFAFIAVVFAKANSAMKKSTPQPEGKMTEIQVEFEELKEGVGLTWKVALLIIVLSLSIFLSYLAVKGSGMEGHLMEWLNLIVRWAHVVAGIAWIGASFYFIFLENSLNRTEGLRDELAGNLWAIHGGGFYYLEKYKVAPKQLPKHLHWFKYEAYFTWITGFLLLWVVYYLNAGSFMIDPLKAAISPGVSIAIGIGTLVISWFVYDLLCKSRLSKNPTLFSILIFGYIFLIAFVLLQVLDNRAAYIHVGAVIGTMMAGNVFFVIIPAQKAMVKAAKTGQPLNPQLGKNAGLRSLHNNYFTLPVIFIMISNHFPSTFGHAWNWIILGVISLASIGVKHFWNVAEQGKPPYHLLFLSIAAIIGLAVVTSPTIQKSVKDSTPVSFMEAQQIINDRCVTCHSAYPTDDVNTAAPNGIMFDTPEQIVRHKDRIMVRAVITKTMPQGNKTRITPEERETLRRWIDQGAKVDI